MSYQKNRVQHYTNLGGMNEKGSAYRLDDSQFFDLRNVDFNIPNALNKRPGSTQMVTTGTSGPINSLYEFERLSGASYLMASSDTAVFYMQSAAYTVVSSGYSNGQPFEFETFVNKLWFCNGQTFLQWDGTTLIPHSLIQPPFNLGAPTKVLAYKTGTTGAATGNVFMGITEPVDIRFATAFVRDDGYLGPINHTEFGVGTVSVNSSPYTAPFRFISGFSSTPPAGVTSVLLFINVRSYPGGFSSAPILPPPDDTDWYWINNPLISGSFFVGSTINVKFDAGTFATLDKGFTGQPFDFASTYHPRYLEIHTDRMFMGGFSAAPSSTYYSEAGLPENIETESLFETRTNDGDRLTGYKSFQGQLVTFKQNSFHKLIGDSPDNYQLVQISTQYGCLSNKAIAEYNNNLVFLDQKGIVRYNGAGYEVISTPVEPLFRRMNVSAAIDKATMVHEQFRNQIWISIPIDGSTQNNITIIYDYLIEAWCVFDGFKAASLTLAKQGLNRKYAWYGNYSGIISYFSPSFFGDNGGGITCALQSKFDAPDGQNIESMFRQLFLDVNTATGVTGTISVEVLSNYDRDTVRATFAIFQNQFQTRRDFGVAGKSVAFNMYHTSASLPLTLYGYLVRRRYLRDV